MHESMREVVAKYNKLLEIIPTTSRPNVENWKGFFLGEIPLDISFQMRRNVPIDLAMAQRLAIELEDDMVVGGKWRKDVQTSSAQTSTSTYLMVQKLVNDLITLKRQQGRSNVYSNPY